MLVREIPVEPPRRIVPVAGVIVRERVALQTGVGKVTDAASLARRRPNVAEQFADCGVDGGSLTVGAREIQQIDFPNSRHSSNRYVITKDAQLRARIQNGAHPSDLARQPELFKV